MAKPSIRPRLPEKADWEDPVYRKWVSWSYATRVRNWKYFNQVTSDCGGEDCKWFGTVSYTHLDVYKRQDLAWEFMKFMVMDDVVQQWILDTYCIPVSYTHLDIATCCGDDWRYAKHPDIFGYTLW